MIFKLQTLQSKQLLQAEGGEGQGEDDVLAIDLAVQGPEETPEEGRLEGKEDRVHRQGGQGSERRSNKSGVWLSFQPSRNLDGTYEAIITTSRNRGKHYERICSLGLLVKLSTFFFANNLKSGNILKGALRRHF